MAKQTKREPEPNGEDEEQELPPLSEDQERAASYLARVGYVRGSNRKSGAIKQCGAYIGVHENTIMNWCKLPQFQARLEGYSDRLIDRAFAGLEALLAGSGAIPPNVTAIIWYLKCQKPELFDDQLRRDEAKRKHEIEMAAAKETKDGGNEPIPDVVVRETLPGERIASNHDDE